MKNMNIGEYIERFREVYGRCYRAQKKIEKMQRGVFDEKMELGIKRMSIIGENKGVQDLDEYPLEDKKRIGELDKRDRELDLRNNLLSNMRRKYTFLNLVFG